MTEHYVLAEKALADFDISNAHYVLVKKALDDLDKSKLRCSCGGSFLEFIPATAEYACKDCGKKTPRMTFLEQQKIVARRCEIS